MGARAIAMLTVVALMLGGPVQPLVLAQQPPPEVPTGQLPMPEPTVQEPAPPPEPTAQQPPGPEAVPEPMVQQAPTPPTPEPTAQQPATPPPPPAPEPTAQQPVTPLPPAPRQQPERVQDTARVIQPTPSRARVDIYDLSAGVVTVAKFPFNVLLCGLGGVVGATVFLATLGSGYRASARAVEEGCRGPWIVRGEDLRPSSGPRGEMGAY